MSNINEIIPKWQKELGNFKGIKNTFIVEGNINDLYPSFSYKDTGEFDCIKFFSLSGVIYNIFNTAQTKDHYDFLCCNPLFGFNDIHTDNIQTNNTASIVSRCEAQVSEIKKQLKPLNGSEKKEAYSDNKIIKTSEIIRAALTQAPPDENDSEKKSVAVIVDYASHYLPSPEGISIDDKTFFLNLLYASKHAIRGNKYINTIILIVDKFNDVPAWFFLNNPNVRTISIPNPDREIREEYINQHFPELIKNEHPEAKDKFIDLTDNMKLLEIEEVRKLYQNLGLQISGIPDAVSIYKYGFKDNPWEKMRDKLGKLDIEEEIKNRVMGQQQAVKKIVNVIKRAVTGLSGMQHSSDSSKPRGILFLAGPTGTGKTEIVKTVAELLFGDEKSLIRFDMSEYRAEHSDQKLFGAPPGYVGYDSGGQLTNAVKNNAFSILLFDEIDKAHDNILDKFLQVLEDGRLTDGQGNTVYFSETFIFFTSNAGIARDIVDPDTRRVIGREIIVKPGEDYDVIAEKVNKALNDCLRPEVINRIGENIVVFNYLDKDATRSLVESKIKKINTNILKKKKINITVPEPNTVYSFFFALSMKEKPRENGGRGVINVIEEYYLNPLAEFIFNNSCKEGDEISINVSDNKIVFRKEKL